MRHGANMVSFRTALFAASVASLFPSWANAQGPAGGAEGPPLVIRARESGNEWSDRIDFAFGVAATSNYISDGLTQSADGPALQGYGEISSGIFYSGIWMSSVELDGDSIEFDLYAGVRGEIGGLALDLSYYRYLYDESGDCCGEWIGKADIALGEKLTLNTRLEIDPQAVVVHGVIGATVAITDSWEFTAAFQENFDTDFSDWNAGATWSMTDQLSMDLRYYGSDAHNDRLVATLAWDFSTAE